MSVLDKLHRRLQLMVTRAVVRLVDPAALMQELQVERLPGEVLDSIEHFEGYGRTAHAPAGAEAIVLGRRGRLVALSVAHRQFRVLNLAKGEQALYDDLGNVIHFKRDRILISSGDLVEVTAPAIVANGPTTINGDVTINGALSVSSTIAATGQMSSTTGISIGSLQLGTHVHGGVQTGAGTTAGPQ